MGLSINFSLCWFRFVLTLVSRVARRVGSLFHLRRFFTLIRSICIQSSHQLDTWILPSCVGWSFIYRSFWSWSGPTKSRLLYQWSLLDLKSAVTCSLLISWITVPFLVLLFWFMFFRTRSGISLSHEFHSSFIQASSHPYQVFVRKCWTLFQPHFIPRTVYLCNTSFRFPNNQLNLA